VGPVGIVTWVGLVVAILAFVLVDLLAFGRRAEHQTMRRAIAWSAAWLAVGLGFALVVWPWLGARAAGEYVAGYLIERSLSLDNLFVFALIFGAFALPTDLRQRALTAGVIGALALRGAMIAGGAALLDASHATIYVFGAVLVITGVRFAVHREQTIAIERNLILRAVRRVVPTTDGYRGGRYAVREGSRLLATPLAAVVLTVVLADAAFAIDSVPAVFAITDDPFLVFATNAFALLGLRALFVLLSGMMERFERLQLGLSVIMVFVGAKMLLADVWHVPTWVALLVVVAVLTASILPSLGSWNGGALSAEASARDDAPQPPARPGAPQAAHRPSAPRARARAPRPRTPG
jgi:tellurite resistance protein TerC